MSNPRKVKGSQAERDGAELLSKLWPGSRYVRCAGSGAFAKMDESLSGDIKSLGNPDFYPIVEVKAHRSFSLEHVFKPTALLLTWILQAKRQQRHSGWGLLVKVQRFGWVMFGSNLPRPEENVGYDISYVDTGATSVIVMTESKVKK